MKFWNALLALDRRWIFLFVALSLIVPLFLKLEFRLSYSKEVTDLFAALERLQPGSKILMSFDYDPASMPELQPMADAAVTYSFRRGLKVIVMGLWPQGPIQANIAIRRAFAGPDFDSSKFIYGVDYVNLGYQAGNEFVIQRMGSSFEEMFPRDYAGNSCSDLPLMRGIHNFNDVDYVLNLSSGYPGVVEWVQIGRDRYNVRLGAGVTAVSAPEIYPFYNTGQLDGLLGGMRGAAEFEALTQHKDKGTKYMLSQTVAHTVIMLFILIGNLAYFATGRKQR